MGKRMTEFLSEWHRETPYVEATDWVFSSFKLKGARPISLKTRPNERLWINSSRG